MSDHDWSKLKRARNSMPPDILTRLEKLGLSAAFNQRPPYQQNDYLGWIGRAKREGTREKRIVQMLSELKKGDRYMKMEWQAAKKKAPH